MVENKTCADFDSFNHMILCISLLSLEKQFQDAYANVKFKKVHEQFKKLITCNNFHLKSESIQFVVSVGSHMIEKIFFIYLNEDEFEVKCTRVLLESRGILC
jgi:hypothetical protein